VRFLLDHMLPARLCDLLAPDLGEPLHVRALGRAEATDAEAFAYARAHDLTIVTKDADFQSLLALHGPPPRVVWLRIGNATTAEMEAFLREHAEAILEFHRSEAGCLVVRR